MPFALRENPEALGAEDLDDYWSRGWFRMRQTLFTTHFLEFEGDFFSAVWLRVGLVGWQGDKKFAELKRRNRGFRVEFLPSPPVPSSDMEDLFARYRDSLTIDVAPSLADLLVGYETTSVFASWEIRVWDGEALVAAGVFDRGETSAAGITSFYDPAYQKHSLGKYLIYLKMEYCREAGLEWFYPGYFVPGRPRFDYKLAMATDRLEYLDLASGTWRAWDTEAPRPDPLATMVDQLSKLGGTLLFNRHLSIHLSPQVNGVELFDFPVFLSLLPPGWGAGFLLVVFDPRDGLYHLVHGRSVYHLEGTHPTPGLFESDLLQVDRLLFSTADAQEMVTAAQFITA